LQSGVFTTNTTSDLQGTNVTFYYIADGKDQRVTYHYLVAGQPGEVHTSFNVYVPMAILTSTWTTESPVVGIRTNSQGQLAMIIGSTNSPGITWTASVGRPTVGAGSVALVQLANVIDTYDNVGMFGPTTHTQSSVGQFILDALTNNIPQYQGIQDIDLGSESTTLTPNRFDTPGIGVDNTLHATLDNHFTDYLMFQSDRDGSIWVTLRKMQWNCSGSASNTSGGWIVDAQSNSKSNSANSTELPVWTNYTGNLPWQP
jgi:hypothetical protein